MTEEKPPPERIDSSFRYGSAIMIGVIAGFSLGFLTSWAANPLPWEWPDLFGLIPLVIGVVLELISVWMLLDPRSLEMRYYMRSIRFFKVGVILVGIGVTLAVAVDYVALTQHFAPSSGGAKH